MVSESVAILLIGFLLLVVFARTRHPGYVVGALPVSIIPTAHLIIRAVLYLSRNRFFGIRPAVVTAFADILGLVISCLIIVIFGMRITSVRNRTIYLVIMLVYTVVLGWTYIFNTISVLFV